MQGGITPVVILFIKCNYINNILSQLKNTDQ